jgi:predicted transposase YdaD
MSTFFQRVREESAREGELRGEQRGVQRGEVRVLLRLLRLKFGEIPEDVRRRLEQADADTLLTWSERILTAVRIEDIFR